MPQTTRRKPPVTQKPIPIAQDPKPQDINHWGREGEKMNPNMPNQPQPNPLPNQQPQQQQQTPFQHRGSMGLQIPYQNPPQG